MIARYLEGPPSAPAHSFTTPGESSGQRCSAACGPTPRLGDLRRIMELTPREKDKLLLFTAGCSRSGARRAG
jgi:hypothetical protein